MVGANKIKKERREERANKKVSNRKRRKWMWNKKKVENEWEKNN